MYLTVKQQLNHLTKSQYLSLRELSHIAKNLTNEAIYNIRQYYFEEGEYLSYPKNYVLLKNSDNYKLLNSNMSQQILKEVDVLIDGKFESDKRDIMLKYRGSSNQRVIDVQNSVKQGKVILYKDKIH